MANYELRSDQELLKLLSFDDDAFSSLYNRYASTVYCFIYKLLKSPELTEDLTQEIFIKLWEKRSELSHIKSFKSYLLTIAKNQSFDFLRKASIDSCAKAEILKHYQLHESSVDNIVENNEYQKFLDKILGQLTPQSREVFRLCRNMGYSYDETAAMLGISRNAVKKHMVRSTKILSREVQRDLGISFSLVLLFFLCI